MQYHVWVSEFGTLDSRCHGSLQQRHLQKQHQWHNWVDGKLNHQIRHYLVLTNLHDPADYTTKGVLIDTEVGIELTGAEVRKKMRSLVAERDSDSIQSILKEGDGIKNAADENQLRERRRRCNYALQVSNTHCCMHFIVNRSSYLEDTACTVLQPVTFLQDMRQKDVAQSTSITFENTKNNGVRKKLHNY